MKKIIFAASVLFLSACSQKTIDKASDPIVNHIDSSTTAGENFFLYANNNWFKNNPIPSTENSNGIFRTIQDTINSAVFAICQKAAAVKDAAEGSNEQKIGDFYSSGMDTLRIEKLGIQPLQEELNQIAAIKDLNGLVENMASLNKIGVSPLFNLFVGRDDKKSSEYAVSLYQGGLGLPDRDYYFNSDARTVNIRNEYQKHIANIFILAGESQNNASQKTKAVFQIETALAKASRKLADTRDPYKNYNKMSVAQVSKLSKNISFENILSIYGLIKVDSIIVGQPEFVSALGESLTKFTIADWQAYLTWNVINNYAAYLNKDFETANFNFYSKTMSGTKSQKPRYKRIVEQTDGALGELVGQIYVANYLPKGTKEKLLEIGENIRTVYADHIKNLSWMSAETKTKALSKLAKVSMKVGYPDKWKDLSSVKIKRDAYLANIKNINHWAFERSIQKYGKPVDKTEWEMTPQTYNAYYNPVDNEIVVPACNIIVPGFEGQMPDDAVLYGIIGGSTFGHEITHGFDDQGSQYDEDGNLKDWWTKQDREKFTEKTKAIVAQYSAYVVLDSMHVNGEATQGENIADLGGVVMGYEAFKKTKQGKNNEMINGLTADQRYFLAYGYAWMVNRRPENLARQIMSDVHSPSEFRVNGPVVNIDEFYKAFNIQKGDKLWRDESQRIKIW
jgi:putative endopeptidase